MSRASDTLAMLTPDNVVDLASARARAGAASKGHCLNPEMGVYDPLLAMARGEPSKPDLMRGETDLEWSRHIDRLLIGRLLPEIIEVLEHEIDEHPNSATVLVLTTYTKRHLQSFVERLARVETKAVP